MFAEAATALGGGSGAEAGASRVVNQVPSSARSGSGMPSSSLITVNGSGKAKPATRSTTVSPRAVQLVEQVVDDRPGRGAAAR